MMDNPLKSVKQKMDPKQNSDNNEQETREKDRTNTKLTRREKEKREKEQSADKPDGKSESRKTQETPSCSTNIGEFVTRSEFAEMNSKLNTLLKRLPALKEPEQDRQDIIHNLSDSENEAETAEDGKEDGEILDSNLEYFKVIAGTHVEEGPHINEEVAKGTSNLLAVGLTTTARDSIYGKYVTPSNCKRLDVIKCNEIIYTNASKQTRQKDSRMQQTQKGMMKSLSIITYAFDHILKVNGAEKGMEKEDTKHLSDMLSDAMAAMSDTSHSLDIQRRQHYKVEFKDEFSPLCNDSYPVMDKLFGSDEYVMDRIKGVSETLKVSHKVNKKTPRTNPYQTAANQRNKFPFLGNRGPSRPQGRGGSHSQYQTYPTYNNNNNNKYYQNHQQQYPKPKPFNQSKKYSGQRK